MLTSSKTSGSEHDHEPPLDLRAEGVAGVWKHVKSLVTNGPYMFTSLYGVFDAVVVNGFVAFGVKFFQEEFILTPTMAGIIFGQSFKSSTVASNRPAYLISI